MAEQRTDKSKENYNTDNWYNTLAGMGKRQDKSSHTKHGQSRILSDEELDSIWTSNGLGRKIVSAPADDMTRNGWEIEGDTDNKVLNSLMALGLTKSLNLALKWMRLYRGAIIVMGVQDGRRLNEPMGTPRGIGWLKVYSARRINMISSDIVKDPASPYYEDVEVFPIYGINDVPVKVHRSRCLVFKGIPVDGNSTFINFDHRYWGIGYIQSVFEDLTNLEGSNKALASLMLELVIGKYKLANLPELISEGKSDLLYKRMEIIQASKSVINGVLLGEGEDYTRDSLSLGGASDVLDRFMMMLSGATEIPITRLFGRSPAGLNATGNSDLRNYYDMITAAQQNDIHDPLWKIISLQAQILNVDVKGVTFNPVWTPTRKEELEAKRMQMEIDIGYINAGVLLPETVMENRFAGGYSYETNIEDMASIPGAPKGRE